MIELLGIVLLVQGGGALISRILGSDSPGWFIQLHLLPPGLHVAASIAMVVVGISLLSTYKVRKERAKAK